MLGSPWRWKSRFGRCCALKYYCSATIAEGKPENVAPGSFFEFLRRQPGFGGGNGQAGKCSQEERPNAEKPMNISSGNLRLLRAARPSRWQPYRSPDTIGQFFFKMDAAIKVGNILREMGWNVGGQRKIAELKVPWAPLVVLQVLRQPLEKEAAWGFFQWLKGVDGYRHTEHTYNSLIEVFGRAKDVAGIQKVLVDMSAYGCGMNVVVFTTVIHWYSRADELDKALEMWNQMTKVGCLPNVVTYTMLMSMLTKLKRFDKVGEIFKDMISAGCRPNVRTYTVLIHCLALSGNLDAALLVFEKLDSLKASPTAATFRVLMDSAAGAGDLELLQKLFEGMKAANQRPNSKMYFAILDSLKKAGKRDEAGALLREMEASVGSEEAEQEQNVSVQEKKAAAAAPLQDLEVMEGLDRPLVDMKAFSTLIVSWGPETVRALEAANFRWDPWKVLRVLMGMRDVDSALKFFYWVEKRPGYKHDSFVYTKMISLLGRAHHFSHVDEVLLKLQSSDIEVGIVTMNSLIYTLAVANKPKLVMKMYYWMSDLKVKANARTYTMIIDMLVKDRQFERAMAIYKEMLDNDCRPDAHTYTVLIQSLGREGKVDEAEDIFAKMPQYGCRPNVVNYTSLINSYIQVGRVKHALVLFNRMNEEGVNPNSITYTIMSKGLRRAKMLHELVEVEKKMSSIDFWKQQRVKSEDEALVHETIFSCLLKTKTKTSDEEERSNNDGDDDDDDDERKT